MLSRLASIARDTLQWVGGLLSSPSDRSTKLPRLGSEDAWKSIADAVQDAIAICDAEGRVEWINAAFSKHSGFDLEELRGLTLDALLGQKLRLCPTDAEVLARELMRDQPYRGQLMLKSKELQSIVWDVRIEPHPGCRPHRGPLFVASDITGRLAATSKAYESVAELSTLRNILEHHVLMSITDLRGKILDVNAGFCEISGYKREELIGRDHRLINSGFHPPEFWREMWRSMTSGIAWRGEVCNRRKNGELYWVHATNVPIFNRLGQIERLASLRFDITDKKHLENSQRSQAEDLSAIFNAVPGVIYRCRMDESWTMDWISDAIETLSGFPHQDFVENAVRTFSSIIHPDDRSRVAVEVRQAVDENRCYTIRYRLLHRSGEVRWVEERGAVVKNEAATEYRSLIGFIVDVTDHQRLEGELRTQKRLLESVIESSITGYSDWEIEKNYQYYSPGWLRIKGYEPGELPETPETWQQLIHPEDLPIEQQALHDHFASRGRIPFFTKLRFRHKSGDTRWLLSIGQVVEWSPEGAPLRMASCHIDVTQAQAAEERLSLAIKSSNLGLWDWDIVSGKTYFSDNYFTMLGYEPGELTSCLETWETLCHPDDLAMVEERLRLHVERSTELYSCEHRLRTKAGGWTWVRTMGEVVERLPNGSPKRMVGVHIDVQQLREMVTRSEAASQSKSEFLANMSHEIRTPMSAILGYADLLGTDSHFSENREQATEAVRTIRNNANHLMAIINDILDMSKIEAGQMKLEWIETDVVQVVSDVASLLSPRAHGKGVALEVSFATAIPRSIQSDPTRLRQILLNLAGNAVKFTEIGSVRINVSCDRDLEQLQFDVDDTGIGMTPEQLEIVSRFEAFSQADTSTSRKFGGTGLGLRISKSLAHLLGGSIHVTSTSGAGSCFSVSVRTGSLESATFWKPDGLVCSTAQRPSLDAKRAGEPSPMILAGKRILLAEDGPDNQRLLAFHLRKAGADVLIAANGEVAIQCLEEAHAAQRTPDLILMDMQMPVLDGYEATRAIRNQGWSVPIVALTAHAMQGDDVKCREAGCNDYLTKPIDKQLLIDTCSQWVTGDAHELAFEHLTDHAAASH